MEKLIRSKTRAFALAILAWLAFSVWVGTAQAAPVAESGAAGTLTSAPGWRAENINDGDTGWLVRGDERMRFRLMFIDAPEAGQPGCAAARDALREMLAAGPLRVEFGRKTYDRREARIWVGTFEVSRALLADGLVWVDPRYTRNPELFEIQRQVHARRRGLWADHRAIAPWIWRKTHKRGTLCD